jgi:hypothetical protein
MNGRIRLSLAVVFIALIFSVLTAAAQPLPWNPPCATLRVKNVTPAPVIINLVTFPPGLVPPVALPAFGVSPMMPMPAGSFITNATSAGGFNYPMVQPGPPSPPAPTPSNGWIPNVSVGPAPNTCVDIYFDYLNCTVYIFPTTSVPPCRP